MVKTIWPLLLRPGHGVWRLSGPPSGSFYLGTYGGNLGRGYCTPTPAIASVGLLGLVAHCHATAGSKAAHGGFPGSESTVRRRAVWCSVSRRASSRLPSHPLLLRYG